MARPGPRTGNADTRQDILDAARSAFASDGYGQSTIRRIAADAGVDPALVHHYFGTKADLYAATIEMPINPSILESVLRDVPIEQMGERMASLFFSIWSDPDARAPLLATLSGAITGHGLGIEAFQGFVADGLVRAILPHVGGKDRALNVDLAVGHLVGVAVLRYVVGVEPLASASDERVVALVAPRVQSYFSG